MESEESQSTARVRSKVRVWDSGEGEGGGEELGEELGEDMDTYGGVWCGLID